MISLLMIDIDHFKQINDTHGHVIGDACLKRVATIIRETARRPTDEVFRYGGEEFAVLLTATEVLGAEHIAEVIRFRIEAEKITINDKRIPITVSIGVAATIPEAGDVSDTLIINADGALYKAKESGRNRVCVFSPA